MRGMLGGIGTPVAYTTGSSGNVRSAGGVSSATVIWNWAIVRPITFWAVTE